MVPEIYKPKKIDKAWGYELHIHNDNEYCGKILHFNKGAKFSMHFHLSKKETWYVSKGSFLMILIDTENAYPEEFLFYQGDAILIPRGQPHQLIAQEESDIFEVSTTHFDADSYRIIPGDSQ